MAKEPALRTSDEQLGLLKATFSENEDLLRAIRNIFLGFEVTEEEKMMIKGIPPTVKDILRKRFTGENSSKDTIGQTKDSWTGLEVRNKFPEFIKQEIGAREEYIKFTLKALALLDDPDSGTMNIRYDSTMLKDDPYGIFFLARQSFLEQVDGQLLLIKLIVGEKGETVEEAKKRIMRDSAR